MITFYVTSHYWEDDFADILDYTNMSEHDIAKFINKHPNGLVKIEPSAYNCVFREKFIEQHLDDGYVQEGVFCTKLNGCTINFRIIENINPKLQRLKRLWNR